MPIAISAHGALLTGGTSSFNGMHGGSGQPTSRLAGYLLGPLNK